MPQHILITGTARGIGLEFVKHYLPMCNKLTAVVRPNRSSEALIQQQKEFAHLNVIEADVAEPSGRQLIIDNIADQSIDLFINNAGVMSTGGRGLGNLASEDWRRVMEVNALAPLLLTQALLPKLNYAQSPVLAYLTSKMGSIADNKSGGAYLYRTSKAALNATVKSLAVDLKDKAKCVLLHPGWVKTDMGGSNALITTDISVQGMSQVIDQLTAEQSGSFFNYDGTVIPW